MALPVLVRCVKSVRPTMTTAADSTVTMVMELMVSWPLSS
jgi:hypothetical protein